MAFEVARVHGIIRSNIREDGSSMASPMAGRSSSSSVAAAAVVVREGRSSALSNPQKPTGSHCSSSSSSSLPSDLHELCSGDGAVGSAATAAAAAAAWPDHVVASSSSSSSPLGSSRRESAVSEEDDDEDDEEQLLAGLADCIMAQTMLAVKDQNSSSSSRIVQRSPRAGDGGKAHSAHAVSDIEANKAAASRSAPSSWSSGILSSGNWQLSSTASSKGSSGVSSRVSSPPTTPSQASQQQQQSDAWDLLYAAAGEVIRLKMCQQRKSAVPPSSRSYHHHQHVHSQQAHSSGFPVNLGGVPGGGMVPRNSPSSRAAVAAAGGSLLSPPSLPYLRNRNEKSAGKEQSWNSTARGEDRQGCSSGGSHQMAVKTGLGAGSSGCQSRLYPVVQHHQHHHQQQQQGCRPGLQKGYYGQYQAERCNEYNTPQWAGANSRGGGGSRMRVVFLGAGCESSGTGVFIPRSAGNGPELERKPACSSVLLPSRIVQLLNLNVENIRPHPSMSSTSLVTPASYPDHKAAMPTWSTMSHSFISPTIGHHHHHHLKPSFKESWLASCGKACPSILQQNTAPELHLPSEWTY